VVCFEVFGGHREGSAAEGRHRALAVGDGLTAGVTKAWTRVLRLVLGLSLWLLGPSLALGQSYFVGTQGVGHAYSTPGLAEAVAHRRVTQVLSLRGHDLLGDDAWRLDVALLMRFDTELGLLGEDPEQMPPQLARRFNALHLLQGHIALALGADTLTLRLGRQVQSDVLGWYDMDALWLQWRLWGPLHFSSLAGLEVRPELSVLNDDAFARLGVPLIAPRDASMSGPTYIVGGGAHWRNGLGVRGDVVYRRSFTNWQDGVGQERLGVSVEVPLGAGARLRAEGAYQFLLATADYLRVEAEKRWQGAQVEQHASLRYERAVPVFAADSIFNVFGALGWQAMGGTWRVDAGRVRASIGGGLRLFDGEQYFDAQGDLAPELRLMAGWDSGLGFRLSGVHDSVWSFAARRHLSQCRLDSDWWWHQVRAFGNLMHVAYAKPHADAEHSVGGQLGASLRLGASGRLDVVVEAAHLRLRHSDWRVFALMDLGFSF